MEKREMHGVAKIGHSAPANGVRVIREEGFAGCFRRPLAPSGASSARLFSGLFVGDGAPSVPGRVLCGWGMCRQAEQVPRPLLVWAEKA